MTGFHSENPYSATHHHSRDQLGVHVNISEAETHRLRHRLEMEISQLSRQLSELRGSEADVDLSRVQTYREMIFSRRALLGRIPR